MADPRSSFRFRMPRLRPSVPPPRATTRRLSTQPKPPAAPPSPPIPPQGVPSTAPPPPVSTTTTTTPAPPVSTTTTTTPAPPVSTTTTTTPAPPPPPPPPIAAAAAAAPSPPPQDEPRSMPPPLPQAAPLSPDVSSFTKPATAKSPEPTKTESQPSSPFQTGIRSRLPSQTPSPSRMSTEPRVSAKPPSPSTRLQPTAQPSFSTSVQPSQPTSPLASPSRLASEKKIASLPPSPIVTTPKLQPKKATSPSSRPVPDIASDNDQKEADLALSATSDAINEIEEGEMKTTMETNEETFMEQPRIEAPKVEEKQHNAINTTSNNIPNTPKTKSMISEPVNTESPQNPKQINRSEASADVNENNTSPRKQFSNEKPLSVITLAGDNRGTSMRINGATKRERKIHIHRKYKVDPDEIADTTTDGEESSNSNGKKSEKDSESTDKLEKNAYINCNIQGINNSMVFNSSFAERNPGVHLDRNPENVNKSKRKKSKPMDMTNPSQKVTTIRRRCLRGLFMETSDSDPDDRQKPRRHGCRYTGGEKSNKEEKMDVV
ncbi:nascent polypeptide-associated complex subunit alpha, muscle-specific form-like [Cynara cardunculus var. scolymus]|uniref:Uncharacterized protein n=1 Tax=Cynara cardunculus var. scolymus TaxID=59895 RepID=A0A103XWY3_CYNCS|nr:nascent polypeptide-associated complex subunit alpha, muscle-specific form-like [Cynara cardunculus var. scolymus]KVH98406.1 hypothetical protein Ccrd_023371 [Cynara cardunculus var. scolymus]